MKKIAFFVEGQTECAFVVRYLKEVIGTKGLIIIFEGVGGKKSARVFHLLSSETPGGEKKYEAYIYVSKADNRVNSDIKDNLVSLKSAGFSLIVGLRDLRGVKADGTAKTLEDLPIMEFSDHTLFDSADPKVEAIVAVMEIETWFIAETNHYQNIDARLTKELIESNPVSIGVNPYTDVLEKVTKPAETLNDIYHLVGKGYSKDEKHRERTVNSLDYANFYMNVPFLLAKVKDFVDIVDAFFS